MGLSEDQQRDVDERIKLYFDNFLLKHFPTMMDRMFTGHNRDCTAHGGVAKKFDRFKWALAGAAAVGVGGGVGLSKLLALIP